MTRTRRAALALILLVDIEFVAWGLMAAAWPDHLPGPYGALAMTPPFRPRLLATARVRA